MRNLWSLKKISSNFVEEFPLIVVLTNFDLKISKRPDKCRYWCGALFKWQILKCVRRPEPSQMPMNIFRHSCWTRIKIGTLLKIKTNIVNSSIPFANKYQPTFETAIAVELNNRLARSSSVIASLLRFGARIINSRRPYQWHKYLNKTEDYFSKDDFNRLRWTRWKIISSRHHISHGSWRNNCKK